MSFRRSANAILAVVVPIAGAVALTLSITRFAALPGEDMSALRITPAVALAHGYRIYTGPDEGPILDQIYGPVSTLLFLPAALASSPSATLLIGGIVNVLAFFLPMVWLQWRSEFRVAAASFALFVFLVCADPGLSYSAFTIHCDAAALGLSACACALLAGRPEQRRLAGSATCAVLAVWAKQSAAPLVVALPLWVLASDGTRAAVRYVIRLGAVCACVSTAFAAWFGARELAFQTFTLLARQPWYLQEGGGKWAAALASFGLLVRQSRWRAAMVAAVALVSRRWPSDARTGRWALLLFVGVAMVPTAVVGGAKLGAFLNAHSYASYFIAGAATLGAGELAARPDGCGTIARLSIAAALGALVVSYANSPVDVQAARQSLAGLRTWTDNPQQHAFEFARAHPGEVYFPLNPLASLQAEGRLDHAAVGIWDRSQAGFAPPPALLRRYLPPQLRWVAFRPLRGGFTLLPDPAQLAPGFTRRVTLPELRGFDVFERE